MSALKFLLGSLAASFLILWLLVGIVTVVEWAKLFGGDLAALAASLAFIFVTLFPLGLLFDKFEK